jgi:hypothetical protein
MTEHAETWRKSSFSGQGNECVEVSNKSRVRDSKNPDGPSLLADLTTLLVAVKSSRLDC